MSAEGSYQELQASGLNFTKLLESSKESTAESVVHLDVLLGASQQSFENSKQTVTSSVDDDEKLNGEIEIEKTPDKIAEISSSGNVSRDVYVAYICAGGSFVKISCLIFICLLTQTLVTGGDYWISYWYIYDDLCKTLI